jgi:catechol 2,3-dioxygenase-like lactoylglutathione lyase family enzyme
MITGAHVLLYSNDPEADRAFFRDVLEFRSVDAGHGWLIFKLPPAEAAVHPTDGDPAGGPAAHAMLGAELYLMCDNLQPLIQSLAAKKVTCAAIDKAPWGIKTTIRLPSGGAIGLYQPTHPTAVGL